MKKLKPEDNARILQFSGKQHSDVSTSEVTRDLFSDTWHNYLDQVEMTAVKPHHPVRSDRNTGLDTEKLDQSRGPVRLFLLKS